MVKVRVKNNGMQAVKINETHAEEKRHIPVTDMVDRMKFCYNVNVTTGRNQ